MDALLRERLATTLQRYGPMSAYGLDQLADAGEHLELAREEHLCEEGRPNDREYFLLEGTLHRYVVDARGERVTTGFHTGTTVITPHFARTVKGRSQYNVQALVPATLLAVPVAEMDRLRYSQQEMRLFGLKVVEQELIDSIRQGIAFRELNARERLLAFRREHPGMENEVPLATIASYLGITPVSFSRLRRELART